MKCPFCKKEISDKIQFCTECGQKIFSEEGTGSASVTYWNSVEKEAESNMRIQNDVENKIRKEKKAKVRARVGTLMCIIFACMTLVIIIFKVIDSNSKPNEGNYAKEGLEVKEESSKDSSPEISDQNKTTKGDEESIGEQDYILLNSDNRYIAKEELENFTSEECRLARNEIYARHGRMFADEKLQAFFDEKDWYTGYIVPDDWDENSLNEFEMYNRDLIVEFEKEMGYR